MTAITQTTWTYTCKVCAVIQNAMISFLNGVVAMGETAGRARAARELTRLGYHAEAKALMLEQKEN